MEQAPVIWIDPNDIPLYREAGEIYVTNSNFDGNTTPLYLKPFPTQKPLSKESVDELFKALNHTAEFMDIVRNIEAAHGITTKE
jgi:hypothetical protein